MDSKWFIPPFKGKSKSSSHSRFSDTLQEQILPNKQSISNIKESKLEENEEKIFYQQKILELENSLKDIKEEQSIKLNLQRKENQYLLQEIQILNKAQEEKTENTSKKERISSQNANILQITEEISDLKLKIEKNNNNEENLYIKIQNTKKKLKTYKEELIKKSKENQLFSQDYKSKTKEEAEFNENLIKINKLEKLKQTLIKTFVNKAKKKKNIEEESKKINYNCYLQSEFRILKLHIQEIDKDIEIFTQNQSPDINSISSRYLNSSESL